MLPALLSRTWFTRPRSEKIT